MRAFHSTGKNLNLSHIVWVLEIIQFTVLLVFICQDSSIASCICDLVVTCRLKGIPIQFSGAFLSHSRLLSDCLATYSTSTSMTSDQWYHSHLIRLLLLSLWCRKYLHTQHLGYIMRTILFVFLLLGIKLPHYLISNVWKQLTYIFCLVFCYLKKNYRDMVRF